MPTTPTLRSHSFCDLQQQPELDVILRRRQKRGFRYCYTTVHQRILIISEDPTLVHKVHEDCSAHATDMERYEQPMCVDVELAFRGKMTAIGTGDLDGVCVVWLKSA